MSVNWEFQKGLMLGIFIGGMAVGLILMPFFLNLGLRR